MITNQTLFTVRSEYLLFPVMGYRLQLSLRNSFFSSPRWLAVFRFPAYYLLSGVLNAECSSQTNQPTNKHNIHSLSISSPKGRCLVLRGPPDRRSLAPSDCALSSPISPPFVQWPQNFPHTHVLFSPVPPLLSLDSQPRLVHILYFTQLCIFVFKRGC